MIVEAITIHFVSTDDEVPSSVNASFSQERQKWVFTNNMDLYPRQLEMLTEFSNLIKEDRISHESYTKDKK